METQTAEPASGGADLDGPPPPVTSKRRRRGAWIAVLAAVVLVAGGLTWFLAYGATYQPLSPGDGYSNPTGAGRVITDGLSDTAVIIVGPEGSKGTYTVTLANNGPRPVRVLGTPAYESGSGLSVGWAPSPDGSVSGTSVPRSFPVTIPAGQQIQLLVTVTQPKCPNNAGEISDLPLRWEALGWHHIYDLPLVSGLNLGFLPIVVCPPATAVNHIDKNA